MGNVRSMIETNVSFLVFIAAATVCLFLFQSDSKVNDAASVSGQPEDRNVHSTLSAIAGDGRITGAEVLQSLFYIDQIGVAIVIDGVVFPVGLELDVANLSIIRVNRMYVPTYKRGTSGELQQIIYKSV